MALGEGERANCAMTKDNPRTARVADEGTEDDIGDEFLMSWNEMTDADNEWDAGAIAAVAVERDGNKSWNRRNNF